MTRVVCKICKRIFDKPKDNHTIWVGDGTGHVRLDICYGTEYEKFILIPPKDSPRLWRRKSDRIAGSKGERKLPALAVGEGSNRETNGG